MGSDSQKEPELSFSDFEEPEFLTPSRDEKITIAEYFVNRIGDEAFYNEFGTSDKFKRYVTSLRRLRDIYDPADLKNYPTIPAKEGQHEAPYMTQNHVQGIKHFFTFIKKYHGLESFNGYPLTQWTAFYPDMNIQIGKNTPKEKSMSGHDKDISTAEVREWYKYLRPDIRPWYLLLCYSGARETHLYAALTDPNKKIEALGGKDAKGKYQKLENPVLFVDATGTVEEGGKTKKLEFGFMFPVELENVVRGYVPPVMSTSTRKKLLTSPDGAPDNIRMVGAANTRKWNTNMMISSGSITGEEIDNIQGRGLNTVQNTNYADMKFKVANAYSKIIPEMLDELPIPGDIIGPTPTPSNSKVTSQMRDQIIELYKAKTSERKIMEIVGVQRNTVSNVLIAAGLKSGSKR